MEVQYIRLLVVFLFQSPGLNPRSVLMGFVVDKDGTWAGSSRNISALPC